MRDGILVLEVVPSRCTTRSHDENMSGGRHDNINSSHLVDRLNANVEMILFAVALFLSY